MSQWEIYALMYAGPVETSRAVTLWNRDFDQNHQRAYYFWCLLGEGGPVVVDAGTHPDTAVERELPSYESPDQVLARLGVDAAAVPHLVLTHLHWDHAGGAGLFPGAQVHVHREEWRFWQEDPVSRRALFQWLRDDPTGRALERARDEGRLVLHDDGDAPLPGLELVAAPGHTPGLMALAADTAQGRAVVGSDCGHTWDNYALDWPSSFICDLPAWLRSMDKLKSLAASERLLIPGHDLAMSQDFPEVAPGVTRLV
ncbi:MAG: N-acyl homoserine lactonase family protein [Desulfarculaceae bacterium]|nr:N-acyl homoserine lactonase family protein [Desulfarculaceae bacterium]MCF8072731.1 N-acyl homoserine lactonase family protein [Desulfarculaceae bacterium]MCF8103035.1 N-acyl homoserine lactonase family protein [Desulfarculaceae bacterium]MCF8118100.1 N-acyl homoserine lactonase family protein [Desulfarculaceae bacterium]